MIREQLRVVKTTREVNWEKDVVTYKVVLKSRDDNIKVSMKMSEAEYKEFKREFSIYPGSELSFTLDRYQRTMDEFVDSGEEKQ